MFEKHISFPLESAREMINSANHHVYRAKHQDTAYELSRAVTKLKNALKLIEQIQSKYPIANPATIDTSIPPDKTPRPDDYDPYDPLNFD